MDRNIKKQLSFIPNLITILNLISGSIAIGFAFHGKIETAVVLMLLAAFFDFFDGFFARLLNVVSKKGKELDSLSDVVSFGLLPGAIILGLIQQNIGVSFFQTPFSELEPIQFFLFFIPFFVPACAALRLAKFNIDERQSTVFYGLPAPGAALLLAGLGWAAENNGMFGVQVNNLSLIVVVTVITALLMVSNIRLLSLKFSSIKLKENIFRYLLLLFSLFLLILEGISGFPAIICVYLILSVIDNNI